mmetsp:Transcript_6576/g.16368  ORF Transcript_6576/g.16368 Transcript_6576/m.16368 type:complete len:265 (-) Transcript_6576:531-1325(-)
MWTDTQHTQSPLKRPLPDLDDLPDFLFFVRRCGDNEETVKKIDGDTVGRFVVGTPDFGDTPVSGEDEDGGHVTLEGSVEERKALHVQHMNLINKEHTRYDVSFPFFSPLSYAGIDLISHFMLNFTSITSKKSKETLLARVDNINLMQRYSVYYLLPLLQLSFGALHEPCLGAHGVVLTRASERTSKSGDAPSCLVNCDNVSSLHLLLRKRLNHLLAKVVHSLHISGLHRDLSRLCSLPVSWFVDLDFQHLSLDKLCLLSDTDTN